LGAEPSALGGVDPPVTALQLCGARVSTYGAVIKLAGHVGARRCTALVDSGASGQGFIDADFAARCGLAVQPSRDTIQLADGTVVPAAGRVTVQYSLAAAKGPPIPFTSTFTVTSLQGSFDLILGVGWLSQHDVAAGWRSRTIEVRELDGSKVSHLIQPLKVLEPEPRRSLPEQLATISFKQLRKGLRRGQVEELYRRRSAAVGRAVCCSGKGALCYHGGAGVRGDGHRRGPRRGEAAAGVRRRLPGQAA